MSLNSALGWDGWRDGAGMVVSAGQVSRVGSLLFGLLMVASAVVGSRGPAVAGGIAAALAVAARIAFRPAATNAVSVVAIYVLATRPFVG
ncbi:hypothetical protein [Mycobacterium attenuatum]|uniref:hypothetical protein n=1 Tax=Mycobacterium attenuatum TaxID=2341086 RepID=UPI0010A97508|nr:hypothetical protein [Mycobacterium attenuatum]